MAKTIKFNLICNGKSVRTLEDLRNNFLIEDILNYYNNKLLHRWLSVHNYTEELKKVESLVENDQLKLIKELIAIFDIEANKKAVEENTYIIEYKKESEFLYQEYKKMKFNVKAIIDDYHTGYIELVSNIIENNNDIAFIKAAIKEIDNNYRLIYELDYRNLFNVFLEYAPMAIFVMLIMDNMRSKYIPFMNAPSSTTQNNNKVMKNDASVSKGAVKSMIAGSSLLSGGLTAASAIVLKGSKDGYSDDKEQSIMSLKDKDIFEMYSSICNIVKDDAKLYDVLGDNLLTFAGATDGYWKDVETMEKKYLILKMASGNYIRATGDAGGDLSATDIKDKFVILEGIDYKSNNANHKLLYMEV